MQRVILVGAGHAHAQVLQAWSQEPLAGVDLVVVGVVHSRLDGVPRQMANGRVPVLSYVCLADADDGYVSHNELRVTSYE